MSNEEKLNIWERVNSASSLLELSRVILDLRDEEGKIQGRTRKFDAVKMAEYCLDYDLYPPNVLTREFGIRQQAIYLTK